MKIRLGKNIIRFVAVIFLGAFLFSFLHSELDFLNYDGDEHSAHDICEIVKNSELQSKSFRDEIQPVKLIGTFNLLSIAVLNTEKEILSHTIVPPDLKSVQTDFIYLFDKKLLI